MGRCSHNICWGCDACTEENIYAKFAENENEDSAEMEKATNEDTSLDSILFNNAIDDDDVAEELAES
jgi:hypothetical protein